MGSYASVYFKNEGFILCGKYIYTEDIISSYWENGKVFFEEGIDEENDPVYYLYGEKEWDCWKQSFTNYNFMNDCFLSEQPMEYDSKTNELFILKSTYNARNKILKFKVDTTDYDGDLVYNFCKNYKISQDFDIIINDNFNLIEFTLKSYPLQFWCSFRYWKKIKQFELVNFGKIWIDDKNEKQRESFQDSFDDRLAFYNSHILPNRPKLEQFCSDNLDCIIIDTVNISDLVKV